MPQPTENHLKMSELLDKALLDVLENGQTALDREGNAVTLTPNAAILSLVHRRLSDRGYEKPVGTSEGAADIREKVAKGMQTLEDHMNGEDAED